MKKRFSYIIYDKEIHFNKFESSFTILEKLEKKYPDVFFSGFSAYENNKCVITLKNNETGLEPCYSDPKRVQYFQKMEWNRKSKLRN